VSILNPAVAARMVEIIELDTIMVSVERLTLDVEGFFKTITDHFDRLVLLDRTVTALEENNETTVSVEHLEYFRTLGITEETVSVESIRNQVKSLWKGIVKYIVEGMKKVKLWAKKIALAIPNLRKLIESVSKLDRDRRYNEVVSLRDELNYLGGDTITRDQLLKDFNNTVVIMRDCFEVDFPSVLSSVENTSDILKNIPIVFNKGIGEYGDAGYSELRDMIKSLWTTCHIAPDVGESNPPNGIWHESLKIRGITSDSHLTFSPRAVPVVGGRYPLMRYPRFNKEPAHAAMLKNLPTVINYSRLGTAHLSSTHVDVYSKTANTSGDAAEIDALTGDQVTEVCRNCLAILDSFEIYYEQFDEIEKCKEDLIRTGNKAIGIITDEEDETRQSVSEFIRNVVRFQAVRLDKPYVSLIGHGVRSMYALMSYCQKSLA